MAIGTHHADVFELAGGTLANFAADGNNVHRAIVTHGARSHAPLVTAKDESQSVRGVIALKKEECEEAASSN